MEPCILILIMQGKRPKNIAIDKLALVPHLYSHIVAPCIVSIL